LVVRRGIVISASPPAPGPNLTRASQDSSGSSYHKSPIPATSGIAEDEHRVRLVRGSTPGVYTRGQKNHPGPRFFWDQDRRVRAAAGISPATAGFRNSVPPTASRGAERPSPSGPCSGHRDPRRRWETSRRRRHPLRPLLEAAGWTTAEPLRGLSIGQRLHWLRQPARGNPA
jgi:hypothetical protein